MSQIKDFVIRGKLSPKLVLNLLKEPIYREIMLKVAAYVSTMKLLGAEKHNTPEWAFPEI